MPKARKTKQRVHRAALDYHTECGIPLDRPGLEFQPTAGNDEPPSCQLCHKQLTLYCATCGRDTVRTRTPDRTTIHSTRYPNGEPIESLKCACGHVGITGHQPVGAKAQKRQLKQQRAQARQHRERAAERHKQRLADEMAREQAEYPHPDTCALCNAPLPRPLSELYRFNRFAPGFRASSISFLPWFYCDAHRELGEELDRTLVATFKGRAIEILEGARSRVAKAASST